MPYLCQSNSSALKQLLPPVCSVTGILQGEQLKSTQGMHRRGPKHTAAINRLRLLRLGHTAGAAGQRRGGHGPGTGGLVSRPGGDSESASSPGRGQTWCHVMAEIAGGLGMSHCVGGHCATTRPPPEFVDGAMDS